MGISIGDVKLFALHFTDDNVVFAKDEDEVCFMVRKSEDTYRNWGLTKLS